MPARKYSDGLLDQAAEMRERGLSYGAIAQRLGMSAGAVYWHCLRLGADSPKATVVPARARGPEIVQRSGHVVRRFTDAEDRRLIEMDQEGAKVCDMARQLSRPANSIRGRLMTLARHEARLEDA